MTKREKGNKQGYRNYYRSHSFATNWTKSYVRITLCKSKFRVERMVAGTVFVPVSFKSKLPVVRHLFPKRKLPREWRVEGDFFVDA